jgi:hypothetical protein
MTMRLITYNYKEICTIAKKDVKSMLRLLHLISEGKYTCKIYRSSYILNYYGLVTNIKHADEMEIFTYIHLSSMRSYYDFMTNNKLSLSIQIAEKHYNLSQLRHNRLLTFTENDIHFIYEV